MAVNGPFEKNIPKNSFYLSIADTFKNYWLLQIVTTGITGMLKVSGISAQLVGKCR